MLEQDLGQRRIRMLLNKGFIHNVYSLFFVFGNTEKSLEIEKIVSFIWMASEFFGRSHGKMADQIRSVDQIRLQFRSQTLNIPLFFTQGFSNATGHQNADEEKDNHSGSDSGGQSNIVSDCGFEFGQATIGVDFVLGLFWSHVNGTFGAAFGVFNATKIGNFTEVDGFPVLVAFNSAAFEFRLDNVPSFGDTFKGFFFVIGHSSLHTSGDYFLYIILELIEI